MRTNTPATGMRNERIPVNGSSSGTATRAIESRHHERRRRERTKRV